MPTEKNDPSCKKTKCRQCSGVWAMACVTILTGIYLLMGNDGNVFMVVLGVLCTLGGVGIGKVLDEIGKRIKVPKEKDVGD